MLIKECTHLIQQRMSSPHHPLSQWQTDKQAGVQGGHLFTSSSCLPVPAGVPPLPPIPPCPPLGAVGQSGSTRFNYEGGAEKTHDSLNRDTPTRPLLGRSAFIVQGSANPRTSGLVNFVTAVAYHFCLNLPRAFLATWGPWISRSLYILS